jgi:aromatic ring-opening dioxygenase catalytic subunit (LigB family)
MTGGPLVEMSIPGTRSPAELFRIGESLSPLRSEGVLLPGSGGIVHNLRRLDWRHRDGPPRDWALDFDRWFAARLATSNDSTMTLLRLVVGLLSRVAAFGIVVIMVVAVPTAYDGIPHAVVPPTAAATCSIALRAWVSAPGMEKNGWIIPGYRVQVTRTPACSRRLA